tara:strand:+ start:2982 stop:3164 length:183 start_codon:yes stop_codon:yes gene_type:complete
MQEIKKAFLFAIIGLPLVAVSNHLVSNPFPTVSNSVESLRPSYAATTTQAYQKDQTRPSY